MSEEQLKLELLIARQLARKPPWWDRDSERLRRAEERNRPRSDAARRELAPVRLRGRGSRVRLATRGCVGE